LTPLSYPSHPLRYPCPSGPCVLTAPEPKIPVEEYAMLKQTTLRALAPLSLALALATGGLALSAPALAHQATRPAQAVSAPATLTAPAPLVNAAELKTLLG